MASAAVRLAECSYTPSPSAAMRLKAQDALSHLVNLEPRDLCNEAIVEKCRATRDLRSCGRIVQHVLVSCGHASLCAECCQRCDVCPICRLPIQRSEPAMRLRLYEECLEAGLISYRDDELRERDGRISADVQRLWSFFDIALENSLVSLITHYVSDVCMDDDAVSSNAVVSMLLDGTVVKEWCEKTFMQIIRSLRDIYSSGTKQMQNKVGLLDKLSIKLVGLSHVLECLEAPSDTAYAPVLELQQLIEGVTRASQHLDAMRWCARYSFLEAIPSSHSTINSWRSAVRARKSAANNRAWPEHTRGVSDASCQTTTLFIEDAMSNIGYGKGQSDDILSMFELGSLKLATAMPSTAFRRREVSGTQAAMHGSAAMYPPESVHAAVDLIFLDASADLILAKKAVFLYYLFDRQWPDLDGEWKLVLDDYMQTFDIPRHVMLESLLFFLLDDSGEIALEKACNILPEVVTFTLHPKVSRVFLERQKPDAALCALRCSGQDNWLSFSRFVREADIPPLSDAVTAVRVRIECGLLTEAYLYQRSYALKLKEQSQEDRKAGNTKDVRNWSAEIDLLVSELCWLCIRKRLVDKLIELPWQAAEERILLRCLLEHASQDPCSTSGNLMVVFYVMRCRNREAFLVHKRLCAVEKVFLEQCIDEGKRTRVRTACAQRTVLVEKAVEVLPKVLQEQLQSGAIEDLLPLSAEVSEPQGKPAALSEKLQGPDLRPHLYSQGKGESLLLPHRMSPDSSNQSGWEDFRQPSILHGRPFKATPGRSSVFPHMDHTSFPSQKENGEGFSPILGRRLIYNADEDSTPPIRKSNLSSSIQGDHQREKQTNYFTDAESELPANINLLSRNLQGQINSSIRRTEPSGTAELRSHKETNGTERVHNGVRSSPGNVASSFINSYSSDIFNSQLENGKEQQSSFVNSMEPASSYKPRRHMLHASPNGKRKAYDQLELCQPDLAPELDQDITGTLFNENGFKQYGKELQKGVLSETESSINASGKSGLRWRAEEDGMELSSPPVPRNKSSSASKRGSRLLRNHAL